MLWQALIWYVVVALGGAAAFGGLRRLGLGCGAAWAVARITGLVLQGYLAWLVAFTGLAQWWWAGLAVIAAMAWWGRAGWHERDTRALVEAELVGLAAFLLLAFLRLSLMAVTATEKPMDLAILATLLRPGVLPPLDPWLAGYALPYYYFGFVPWLLPAKLVGFAPDVVYNLLVPTLAGVSAQGAWALARGVGGSRRAGGLAAFLVVFSGTADGWRQLLSGTALAAVDLWPASRAIKGTITEFPLFTFHLGDLHPHLLCVPLALVAILLGRMLGATRMHRAVAVGVAAVLYGAASAANPWCAIPVGAAILLVAIGLEGGFVRPTGAGRAIWVDAILVGGLGWLLFTPFWLQFHPPTEGFGWVHSGTRTDELLLLLGGALLPSAFVAWELAWRSGGLERLKRQAARATWLAGSVLVIILTRRVLLGLVVGIGVLFARTVFRGSQRGARPVLALALVPLGLLAFMELVYFKDPYGTEYYRMNTVFKATHLAFMLLAVTGPALLGWLHRRRPAVAVAGALVVVLVGVPQFAALTARAAASPVAGWSGLKWMAPGEAATVGWLRTQPRGTVLIEGVGDAYSDAGRMSACSGVPAVLGWDNHESVWRGNSISAETGRRKAAIERLYKSGDQAEIKRIAKDLGAQLVVVGAVERRLYPAEGVAAVAGAGTVAFRADQCLVVAVGK
jgi:YYY domain-containing protein